MDKTKTFAFSLLSYWTNPEKELLSESIDRQFKFHLFFKPKLPNLDIDKQLSPLMTTIVSTCLYRVLPFIPSEHHPVCAGQNFAFRSPSTPLNPNCHFLEEVPEGGSGTCSSHGKVLPTFSDYTRSFFRDGTQGGRSTFIPNSGGRTKQGPQDCERSGPTTKKETDPLHERERFVPVNGFEECWLVFFHWIVLFFFPLKCFEIFQHVLLAK